MSKGTQTYVKNEAPDKLELVVAIVNAGKVRYYTNLIQSAESNLQVSFLVSGTSEKAIMDYLGLNQLSRSAIFAVVRSDKVKELMNYLEEQFSAPRGGGGIAVSVSLTSVIGKMLYGFLSNDKRTIQQ